jgi:hypothetical protein
LQNILLDCLLQAEERPAKRFSIAREHLKGCRTVDDANLYREFFARCLSGRWNVSLHHHHGDLSFEFSHV